MSKVMLKLKVKVREIEQSFQYTLFKHCSTNLRIFLLTSVRCLLACLVF